MRGRILKKRGWRPSKKHLPLPPIRGGEDTG